MAYQRDPEKTRIYQQEYRERNAERLQQYRQDNAVKFRADAKRWRENNLDKVKATQEKRRVAYPDRERSKRRAQVLRSYNLTEWTFEVLLNCQGGLCAVCGNPLGERFAIDHDHACCPATAKSCGKCVRGLLCAPCNNGLGSFRDSVLNLEHAINYLEDSYAS